MFLLVVLLIAMKMRSSGRAKASHSVLKRTLLTHVQTLSIILSLNVNWHPSLYEFLVAISSVVNVSAQGSVIQFCSELSKPKDTLEVLAIVLVCASLLPFAFCGLLFAYWMCLAPRCKVLSCGVNLKGITSEASKPESGKSRTRSPWDGFAMSLGLITYIAYPSIIRVSFLILKFVTVCGKRWVFMDEKFEYMGKEHLPIVLGVALPSIIVYSVMLPIFSAFALSKAKRTDPNVIFKYGLVYSGYAERMWYWELVIFFRKFAMILIVTFALEGVMQLQCTLLLLAVMLHVQHQYKPFHARAVDDDNDSSSEEEKNILHQTDLASLCVLFFCVWSASFFKGETENIDGNSDWLLVFAIVNIVGNIILILTVCFQITKLFARRNSKNLSNMRSRIEMISSRMFGKRDVVSDESAGVDKEEIDFTVNVMYKNTKTNEGDDNSRWSM
jgi:hypothetical protein